jgi:hypothetical protein
LIWSRTFFEWYTLHNDQIDKYKKVLQENIFICIETLKQQYTSIMEMPVKRFHDLLKWKADLEEEKAKLIKEKTGAGKKSRGK